MTNGQSAMKMPARPRVVVLGAGFAGLNAAQALGGMAVDVTVIDRRNHHTFQPLLYQVASGVLSPADVAAPIRTVLRHKRNVEVLMDEVIGFDLAKQTVQLRSSAEIPFDYLIVATGSTHSYFGHDAWAKLAPGLKTVEDATEMRRRIMLAYELAEREAVETGKHPPLNFVVVGGGPTGVELAGAIRDIASLYLWEDYRHIDTTKTRVMLIEGGPHIVPSYPPDLQQKAVEQLQSLGVEIMTGKTVTDVEPGYVIVGKPPETERIDALVTLWAAGVQASPVGKMLGVPVNRKGAVAVDEYLNPPGHRNIFICGDLAEVTDRGKPVPGVAQPAMQMGTQAAHMIAADMEGKARKPFHYFDKGDMATIGRNRAIADVKWPFKAHLGGLPAWITWGLVHIYFLIGFRSRIAVMFQWAWTYLTLGHGARLITGSQKLPGWDEQQAAHRPVLEGPIDLASPANLDPAVVAASVPHNTEQIPAAQRPAEQMPAAESKRPTKATA
ncbi:MAG TPA: NAD(P)/FAD-dependent oxidoreductase [Acidobacteriaceae bacterium]|jgi:NADH dehydrogenase